MNMKLRCVLTLLTFALPLVSVASNANAQSWVSTATQAYPVSTLSNATLIGPLSPATQVHVVLGLQEQNASQVQPTLLAQLTPGNALYGTTMTVEQFASQFGVTSAQITAVTNYLTSMGFTNITVSPNNLMIDAYATAGEAEAAFNTTFSEYSLNGTTVFLNTTAAQVPESLSGIVVAVLGLNNIARLYSDIRKLTVGPMTVPCTPPSCPTPDLDNESYGPRQYQIAYDAACPSDNANCAAKNFPTGSTTTIGVIAEGDLTQVVTDLRTYESTNGLPEVPVTVVNAGLASSDTTGEDEWDLDSQSSTGIAQQVSQLYFYVATSLTDSDIALAINKAVTANQVRAFNMSFGECEFYAYVDGSMLVDDETFGEAALHGQTPFASSGDQGSGCPVEPTNGVPASGPPSVAYPASSPYVVASGGTNLFTNSDFTYDFETGWEAGGGGISLFETSPFWQSYTGGGTLPVVPSAEDGDRGVPDVAMCAGGTELAICAADIIVDGASTLVGGTSLSSPLSMGSWARILSAHKGKLGFAAPLIYQLASSGPPPTSPDFNDVTIGANGFYECLPGYDYVTGLGSWDIAKVSSVIPSSYPQ